MRVIVDGCTRCSLCFSVFFFNDTATTEIYTLSLHDALPICLLSDDMIGIATKEWMNGLEKIRIIR